MTIGNDRRGFSIRRLISASVLGLIGVLLAVGSDTALADGFPTRPVRYVLPWPPGGGGDIIARTIAQNLTPLWGQNVFVDNRPGAAGNIGAELLSRSAPDGYTIGQIDVSMAINASLHPEESPDPIRDFTPIIWAAVIPQVLVVHPSVPAKSVAELLALARATPGKLTYASAGIGSALHLAGAQFTYLAKVDILHVPYKGGGPALTDLLSGQVSMMFGNLAALIPQINSGNLRALAVTGTHRSAVVPTLPTVAEAGLPGYEFSTWFAVVAPTGAPPEIMQQMNRDIGKVLRLPAVQAALARQGAEITGGTSAELASHIEAEVTRWREIVKATGIRAE
jgi:tripartite-type tricarboxylate transporter receptor subunit TctC